MSKTYEALKKAAAEKAARETGAQEPKSQTPQARETLPSATVQEKKDRVQDDSPVDPSAEYDSGEKHAHAQRPQPQPAQSTSGDKSNRTTRPVLVNFNPSAEVEEQYQRLYTNLIVRSHEAQAIQTLMIVGAHHGDGVTTTSTLFARMLAQSRRVLLIDANLRTPALADVFQVRNNGGFSEFLARKVALDGAISPTDVPNLFVMTSGAGPFAPPYLFEGGSFDELILDLREKFNYIIFDAAPMGIHLDATFLANRVDGVILIIKAESTLIEEGMEIKRKLEESGARILGVIVNRAKNYVPKFVQRLIS